MDLDVAATIVYAVYLFFLLITGTESPLSVRRRIKACVRAAKRV